MSLKVEVCADTDMPRAFAIISAAFGHEHPYFDALYPDHDQPLGRKQGGERLLAVKHNDPNTIFLKVTDTSTEDILAVAKWNVYDDFVPEEQLSDGPYWASQEEKEYAQQMFHEFMVSRMKAIRESGGKLVSLDILTVDPIYQKRGAGRMLVQWGTNIADQMGVETVVEATEHARHLYESEGFELVEHCVVSLPEKWAQRGRQEFLWMTRPAKKDHTSSQQ